MLMATNFGRVVIYFEGFLLIRSHDPSITFSCKITWQTEIMFSLLPQSSAYDQQTWQDSDLPWGAPTHNVTRPFGHAALQDHVTD